MPLESLNSLPDVALVSCLIILLCVCVYMLLDWIKQTFCGVKSANVKMVFVFYHLSVTRKERDMI